MVIDWMYGAASQSGWWMGPYSTGGDSHEGILRNTGALKNGISMLGEARAAAGTTRPAEGGTNSRPNEHRKVYGHLWENWEGMRYFAARMDQIVAVNKASVGLPGRRHDRPHGAARLLPVAAHAERRREPERPAGRGHAAGRAGSSIRRPCGYFIPQAEYDMPRDSIGPTRRPGRLGRRAPRDPRHPGRAAGRRRPRAAQAAAARPDRPAARLRSPCCR